MSRGKKQKKRSNRTGKTARLRYDDRLKAEADNRRKLLDKLDQKTAEWTRREFAKLRLFQ